MKKRIFSLMIGAIVALTSCSKSDEASNLPQSGEQLATFNIEVPAVTRATVDGLTRYIVEAYEGNNLTNPPLRTEAAQGSLTLALKQNTDYTFVFWADKGTVNIASGNYYNTDKLQEVVVTAGKENTIGEEAYCLTKSFNSNNFQQNNSIVLKNATAQLNLTEAVGLLTPTNTLKVKYMSSGKLNVATGRITEVEGEVSRTYTDIGMLAKDAVLATDYILAPLNDKRLLTLKLQFNYEPEKTITGVPLQQNYKTSVNGEFNNVYSSEFTVSNQVKNYTNNPDLEFSVRVGDFYYKDKTFSSTYTADAQNPCIGIVCEVNADRKSGKIMSLYEEQKSWTMNLVPTNTYSSSNGAENTAAVYNVENYSETIYPAFAWCATKNTPNSNPAGIEWYIPAKDELLNSIYANRSTLNTSLSKRMNSALLTENEYWSSTTELQNYFPYIVHFKDGKSHLDEGYTEGSVRLVSAF